MQEYYRGITLCTVANFHHPFLTNNRNQSSKILYVKNDDTHSSTDNQSHQLLHHLFCFFLQLVVRGKFFATSGEKNKQTAENGVNAAIDK